MDEDYARISSPDSETLQKSLDEISDVYSQISDEPSLVRELAKLRLQTSQEALLNLTKQQKDVEEAIRTASTQPSRKSSLLDQAMSTSSYSPSVPPSVSGSDSGISIASSWYMDLLRLESAQTPLTISPTRLESVPQEMALPKPSVVIGKKRPAKTQGTALRKKVRVGNIATKRPAKTQGAALRKKPRVGTVGKKRESLRIQTKPRVSYSGMQNSSASSGSSYVPSSGSSL
jgi:hypothetical protein